MTKTFKPKTRKMPEDEYRALVARIYRIVQPLTGPAEPTEVPVWMFDGDWMPTQRTDEVRFIMIDNPYDVRLFIVDNAGDAVLIEKEYA